MKNENNIKKYQLSLAEKTRILFRNFQPFEVPVVESLKATKFDTIDDFVDRIMYDHDKDNSDDQDFIFTIDMEPNLEESLKEFLIKHKKFILEYTISQEFFYSSHIYQLYLEYIPYELTNIEKSIFLDAYINMVTDLRGNKVSDEKRKRLEKRLSINQD